jgi:hypothetical protein
MHVSSLASLFEVQLACNTTLSAPHYATTTPFEVDVDACLVPAAGRMPSDAAAFAKTKAAQHSKQGSMHMVLNPLGMQHSLLCLRCAATSFCCWFFFVIFAQAACRLTLPRLPR